jgi:hypothetical protein
MKPIVLAVCLALAVTLAARAEPGVDPYPTAYAASMRDRLPVLVFVGQPAHAVSGTRSIAVSTFPDATAPCVVVGVVRDGAMARKDLGGTPAAPDIQVAVASLSAPGSAEALDEVNAARGPRPAAVRPRRQSDVGRDRVCGIPRGPADRRSHGQ